MVHVMTQLENELRRILMQRSNMLHETVDQIVALFEQHNADKINRLTDMLADRTDELIRLKRLVGEEA